MILDRGCSLDVADLDGDTALHLAVRRQNNEILAVLLRKGANPDIKNTSGECPIHESIRNGLIPTAQLLLRGILSFQIEKIFILSKSILFNFSQEAVKSTFQVQISKHH